MRFNFRKDAQFIVEKESARKNDNRKFQTLTFGKLTLIYGQQDWIFIMLTTQYLKLVLD